MEPNSNNDKKWPTGAGIGLGIAIGAGIGVALGNLPIGVAVGVAIGVALDGQFAQEKLLTPKQKKARVWALLAAAAVFAVLVGLYFFAI